MTSYSKISIITPSFNQAQYLEQTIDSVLSQNYPNLEYIIIDGGSTDGSVDIIKRHEKHLAYWVSETDNGQSHAINKGVKGATGEVINWLNSDDYFEPHALKTVAEIFDDPTVNCFCARSRLFDENGPVKFSNGTDIYPDNLAKTIGWARIDQPETFYGKSAWEKVGMLNEQLHYTMDREWWMRYLFSFGLDGIKKTDDVLVNFRLHNHSKSVSQSELFQTEHYTIFFSLLADSIPPICTASGNNNIKINTLLSTYSNHELIDTIGSYFCLKQTDISYYQKDYRSARKWLNFVSPSLLSKSDKKLFTTLKSKLLIPNHILNLIR
jgi:glycosyltransferase involved in cell wall biosynthesis